VIRVTLNSDAPRLLFNGTIQTVTLSYEGKPSQLAYAVTAIDDTPRANARLPYGAWTNISATTVAQELVATFAPGFTATHVEAGLPLVTMNLDSSEGFNGALRQLAKLIGGYFYWEDFDLHLFQTEATDAPATITGAPGQLLDTPPIRLLQEMSQIRTRVYGKGHGNTLLTDVAAGETILPLDAVAMFSSTGGAAMVGTQRLTYTGKSQAGPTTAPTGAAIVGTGVDLGSHTYAYTFVTASGETVPSGTTAAVTRLLPSPATPVAVAVPGAGVETGVHDYGIAFVTAAGETTPGPLATVTVGAVLAAPNAPTFQNFFGGGGQTAGTYKYAYTFLTAAGETEPSALLTVVPGGGATGMQILCPAAPEPTGVTGSKIYRTAVNGAQLKFLVTAMNAGGGAIVADGFADAALGANAPTTNTTVCNQVSLSAIPVGPTGVTARKVYRTAAGGAQLKLIATIADNTTTTYLDAVADASLGANALTVTTALQQSVAVAAIATGPVGTTARKVYRSAAGTSTPLKLLATIADNTTTTYTDTTADGSLGATAPTTDTSALVIGVLSTTSGSTAKGAAAMTLASATAFPSAGWAQAANQVVRYTSTSATQLLGIPANGPGAVQTTIPSATVTEAVKAITGVPVSGTGALVRALVAGDMVHLWVQRDDLAAQAALVASGSTAEHPYDGVLEHLITDERRGVESLTALCDADLVLFSRPILTVPYACRDVLTKAGKPITFNLASPVIQETLVIQDVTMTEIDIADALAPRFTATASSVRFSLSDLLRRMNALIVE
jgi:hypothetical protein